MVSSWGEVRRFRSLQERYLGVSVSYHLTGGLKPGLLRIQVPPYESKLSTGHPYTQKRRTVVRRLSMIALCGEKEIRTPETL